MRPGTFYQDSTTQSNGTIELHKSLDHCPPQRIQRDLVPRAVVELGGAQRLVGGDRLGVADSTAIEQTGRSPSRLEGVAVGRYAMA